MLKLLVHAVLGAVVSSLVWVIGNLMTDWRFATVTLQDSPTFIAKCYAVTVLRVPNLPPLVARCRDLVDVSLWSGSAFALVTLFVMILRGRSRSQPGAGGS